MTEVFSNLTTLELFFCNNLDTIYIRPCKPPLRADVSLSTELYKQMVGKRRRKRQKT